MLRVKERKDGTLEINTGQKGKSSLKIDWKGMLGDKLPEPKITITLKKPRGRPKKYPDNPEELIADAKKRIRAAKKAGNPINGRREFERAHTRLYQKLCKKNLQEKIWPEKKRGKGKYEKLDGSGLVAEALVQVKEKNITNLRELCRKCRFLYNHLRDRELLDAPGLAHLRKKGKPQT